MTRSLHLLLAFLLAATALLPTSVVAADPKGVGTLPATVTNDDAFTVRLGWAVDGFVESREPPSKNDARAAQQQACSLLLQLDYIEFVFGGKEKVASSVLLQRTDQLIAQPTKLKASKCVARDFQKVSAADFLKAIRASFSQPRPPLQAREFLGDPSKYKTRSVAVRGDLQKESGEYKLTDGKSSLRVVFSGAASKANPCGAEVQCSTTLYGVVDEEGKQLKLEAYHWER